MGDHAAMEGGRVGQGTRSTSGIIFVNFTCVFWECQSEQHNSCVKLPKMVNSPDNQVALRVLTESSMVIVTISGGNGTLWHKFGVLKDHNPRTIVCG